MVEPEPELTVRWCHVGSSLEPELGPDCFVNSVLTYSKNYIICGETTAIAGQIHLYTMICYHCWLMIWSDTLELDNLEF